MKALRYLLSRIIKNSVKEFVKSPAKLILALILVLLLGMTMVTSIMAPPAFNELRDIKELFAIAFVLYLFIFLLGTLRGLSSGATFYSMSDVNLLFATPISQPKILFYGLLRQAGTALFVGFFLLFQYANLHNIYGVGLGGMILLLLGYCVTMFCSNLSAMLIYSFTSSNEKAKLAVRIGLYLLTAAAAAYVLLNGYFSVGAQGGMTQMLTGAVSAVNSLPALLYPVAGWLTAAVSGMMTGNLLPAILGLGCTVLFIAVAIFAVVKHNSDFYEDVLKATEISYSAITAKKEGKMAEALPQNVKVGKTGLQKGKGASAFYYKHLIENRRGKLFLFDLNSLIFIGTIILFAFFMKDSGIFPIFIMATYMQIFSIAMGRWAKELLLPYVYLVPQPPFRKLLMISLENIRKIAIEAVVIFIPVGIILSMSPLDILFVIAARIGYGVLFMAGNLLVERLFGSVGSKTLVMIFYFLAMFLIAIPGIVISVIAMTLIPGAAAGGLPLLATAMWNIPISLLITFLCRNILDIAELNNR